MIDPGPEESHHLAALRAALTDADSVTILLTHAHEDHAGGAAALGRALDAPIRGYGPGAEPLRPDDEVHTDEGLLRPVETPGHARRHLAFHWPEGEAIFPGDLILGEGATTWVGAYPECVQDYLDSLGELRALAARVIYPAHGAPIDDPEAALERFEAHRRERIRQVEEALSERPRASVDDLVERIYGGDLSDGLGLAARKSVEAILHHLGRT